MVAAARGRAQGGAERALLQKPLGESWPTYNGDYSGKRYSTLTQINQANVKNLTLAWTRRLDQSAPSAPGVPTDRRRCRR